MPVKGSLFFSVGTQLLICRFMEFCVSEIHVCANASRLKCPHLNGKILQIKMIKKCF